MQRQVFRCSFCGLTLHSHKKINYNAADSESVKFLYWDIELSIERKIKYWLYFFIVGMFLSGATAIPLEWQMGVANRYLGMGTSLEGYVPGLSFWVTRIYTGLAETYSEYPFIAYGTDWLAFAHFVLAILFIGPLRDPVRNIWVIEFGIISCVLVIPFAMVFGAIREIPFLWRLADCSFGVIGIIPLLIVRKQIKSLQQNVKT